MNNLGRFPYHGCFEAVVSRTCSDSSNSDLSTADHAAKKAVTNDSIISSVRLNFNSLKIKGLRIFWLIDSNYYQVINNLKSSSAVRLAPSNDAIFCDDKAKVNFQNQCEQLGKISKSKGKMIR